MRETMNVFLTFGITCYLHYALGQEILGVLSLDDIIRNTNLLENAVQDLSGTPAGLDHIGHLFHGKNVHHSVDLSGNSATRKSFDDLAAIGNTGLGFQGNSGNTPTIRLQPIDLSPGGAFAERDHAPETHVPVHLDTVISGTDGFLSPTDGFTSVDSGIQSNFPHGKISDIPLKGGNVHVDLPGEHRNPSHGAPVIHSEVAAAGPQVTGSTHGMPFVHRDTRQAPSATPLGHSLQQGVPIGNVHVDMPGEHGNPIDGLPVVHREGPAQGVGPQQGFPGAAIGSALSDEPMGNVHVDLPGQHGNPADGLAVVHREGPSAGFGQNTGNLLGSVHVDLPGQHGNPADGVAIVHREGPSSGFGQNTGNPLGSVHVDLPGQHGNPADGLAVVHREGPSTGIGQNAGNLMGSVHVDLPGQHGNPADGLAVVHREGPPTGLGQRTGSPVGSVPGQHGNPLHGHPVDHRVNEPLGHNLGSQVGSVHVDLPGEHGNPIDGVPVIHREGPQSGIGAVGSPVGNAHVGEHGTPSGSHREGGTPVGTVQVDMPGQHGNPIGSHPIVHREPAGVSGSHVGTQHEHTGIHIDAPGEHGNTLNEPALHLPPGATIEDAFAAGVIRRPGRPDLTTGFGQAFGGISPGMRSNSGFEQSIGPSSGFVPGFGTSPQGRVPGFANTPVGLTPVVRTGVLPGTPNVPVPARQNPVLVDPHNHGHSSGSIHLSRPVSSQNLGDMLGIPTVDLSQSTPIASPIGHFDQGWDPNIGLVEDRNVLLSRGGLGRFTGLRGGRWRRQGRRIRWQKPATQTTTTTTTPAPINPGNGITVIRTAPPNPLDTLGDVLRSALIGGNGGGGLLGSLVQSALGIGGPPGGRPIIVPLQPQRRPLIGNLLGRRK